MKTTKNYTATITNGIWSVGNEDYVLTVNDENLTEAERETLENGTSNDIKNFVNNSGNF